VDYFAANSLGISIHECEAKFSRFCIFVRRQNATSGVSVHQLEELRLPVNNILRKIGLGWWRGCPADPKKAEETRIKPDPNGQCPAMYYRFRRDPRRPELPPVATHPGCVFVAWNRFL